MKSIKQLENIDKPREKLIKKGANALKDYELLAVLLGSGVQGKDVIKLSHEIIKLFEEDFDIKLQESAAEYILKAKKKQKI